MQKQPKDLTNQELKEALASAARILSLMDSPFPDAIERQNKAQQSEYVSRLRAEMDARFD